MIKENKPKLLIHVGYHKTGSTFWQKNIFRAENINLLDRAEVQHELLQPSVYEFSKKHFNDWLSQRLVPNQLNVISDEELSGNIHTYGNGRSITFEMIERLSEIEVADVYILMFIRNQVDMIDSCYRQYVKRGGSCSFNNYVNPKGLGSHRHRFPRFSLEHFRYDDVISHWYRKLDKESVLIYTYERFKQSPDEILKDLSQKLSIPLTSFSTEKQANKGLSNVSITLARISNRMFNDDPIAKNSIFSFRLMQLFFIKIYTRLDGFFPRFKKINYFDNEMKEKLDDYYHESNKKTEKLLELKLSDLNYSMNNNKRHSK